VQARLCQTELNPGAQSACCSGRGARRHQWQLMRSQLCLIGEVWARGGGQVVAWEDDGEPAPPVRWRMRFVCPVVRELGMSPSRRGFRTSGNRAAGRCRGLRGIRSGVGPAASGLKSRWLLERASFLRSSAAAVGPSAQWRGTGWPADRHVWFMVGSTEVAKHPLGKLELAVRAVRGLSPPRRFAAGRPVSRSGCGEEPGAVCRPGANARFPAVVFHDCDRWPRPRRLVVYRTGGGWPGDLRIDGDGKGGVIDGWDYKAPR